MSELHNELREGFAHMTALDLVTLAIKCQPDMGSPVGFELARRAREIDGELRTSPGVSGRRPVFEGVEWYREYMQLPLSTDHVALIHDEPPTEPDRDAVPAPVADVATARTRTR